MTGLAGRTVTRVHAPEKAGVFVRRREEASAYDPGIEPKRLTTFQRQPHRPNQRLFCFSSMSPASTPHTCAGKPASHRGKENRLRHNLTYS